MRSSPRQTPEWAPEETTGAAAADAATAATEAAFEQGADRSVTPQQAQCSAATMPLHRGAMMWAKQIDGALEAPEAQA